MINFEKMAYELGQRAALEGFEKDAFIAPLKALYGAGKGLFSSGLGRAGQGFLSAVGKRSPGTAEFLRRAGRGATGDMWGFGLFGGGMGALMDPEDRWGGFLRGAAGGALGGLGWRAGGNIAREGIRRGAKALGPEAYKTWGGMVSRNRRLFRPLTRVEQEAAKAGAKTPGMWSRRTFGAGRQYGYGEAAKMLGQRAALGAVPLAAAFGGMSVMEPSFEPAPTPMPAIPPQAYYAAMQYAPQMYQAQRGY